MLLLPIQLHHVYLLAAATSHTVLLFCRTEFLYNHTSFVKEGTLSILSSSDRRNVQWQITSQPKRINHAFSCMCEGSVDAINQSCR